MSLPGHIYVDSVLLCNVFVFYYLKMRYKPRSNGCNGLTRNLFSNLVLFPSNASMQTKSSYLFILFDVTKCLYCLFTKDITLERVREILIQAEPRLLDSIGIVFKSVSS